VPSRAEIISFDDSPPPPGADAWVAGAARARDITIAEPDPDWPQHYAELAGRIRGALGWRVLQLEHVGSTSVPGLPAKPIIDIDLTVADPGREQDYVPALEAADHCWARARASAAGGIPASRVHSRVRCAWSA
jgi:GrpB-like predicted nucleotidyltransferase (UPF0157 family)